MSVLFALAIFFIGKPIADQAQVVGEQIRILPVPPTPESKTVTLKIPVPQSGEIVNENPVWVQFRLDGYPLGAGSRFDRADEIGVSTIGQSVHVIIDDLPYFPINQPAIDPFNEEGFYYDTSYKFEIPYRLKAGAHTIRMFPARSFGESLKGENTFAAVNFYVGKNTGQEGIDLQAPYLTYNEPSDQIPLGEANPILLDFYLKNCELTSDGYKVRVTIDKKMKRTLTAWQPYYIYGLKRGSHSIRLELVDGNGKPVPGPFNDIQRTIQVGR